MKNLRIYLAGVGIGTLIAVTAMAQEDKPYKEETTPTDEIQALINEGLPEFIRDDNAKLVQRILAAKTGPELDETFNIERAVDTLFEGKSVERKGKCESEKNESEECHYFSGEEAGEGAYSTLSYRSTPTETSIRFLQRRESHTKPSAIELSDEQAYDHAIELLLKTMAVPEEGIPVAPKDAKRPIPVRTVNLSIADDRGTQKVLPVQKVMKLQRGLQIEDLGWIPGPGELFVAFGAEGLDGVSVRNWADMKRFGENVDPQQAKSRKELVKELTEIIEREGITKLESARSVLAVSLPAGAEVPLPVLRVFAAAQAKDLSESEQTKVVSSSGVVIEVPLVAINDEPSQEDDT